MNKKFLKGVLGGLAITIVGTNGVMASSVIQKWAEIPWSKCLDIGGDRAEQMTKCINYPLVTKSIDDIQDLHDFCYAIFFQPAPDNIDIPLKYRNRYIADCITVYFDQTNPKFKSRLAWMSEALKVIDPEIGDVDTVEELVDRLANMENQTIYKLACSLYVLAEDHLPKLSKKLIETTASSSSSDSSSSSSSSSSSADDAQ